MSSLTKIRAENAAEIGRLYRLDAEARTLLAENTSPSAFLDGLIAHGRFADAVQFLAHALPKREAVWWACLCARQALPSEMSREVAAALLAAETWVYKPTEENRAAAAPVAETAGTDSPAAWCALAAAWSGRDMPAPEGELRVPLGETMTASAVSAAVIISGAEAEPAEVDETYRRFLEQGIDIASGGSGRRKPATRRGEMKDV